MASSECSEQIINLEIASQGIATLTLNRPATNNAFDAEMIQMLNRTLNELAENSAVRVLKLKGKGKHFCAGADLNWMKASANYSQSENEIDALRLAQLLQFLYEFPKPTIARVQGACYGGGVGLVSCCDIVLAEHSARFCLSEVKLGLIPAVISPYVINAIGARHAKRYMQTAEEIDAETAFRIHLAHECAETTVIDAKEIEITKRLLNNGPCALGEAKRLVHQVQHAPIDEHLSVILAKKIAAMRVTPEAQEGLAAFLEKRKASYQNV